MALSFTSYGAVLLALMIPLGTAINTVQMTADARIIRDVLAMKSSEATPMGDSITKVLDVTDMGHHDDGTVSIEFGGVSHKSHTEGHGKHLEQYLTRPEAVKSKVCTGSACEDCASKDSCWHGIDEDGWGFMEVVAQAGQSHTRYEAEVWARCVTDGAKWKIKVYDCENGEIVVYVDGKELKRTSKKKDIKIDMKKTEQARIKITFEPSDLSKKSEARYYMYAEKMDESVDGCMTAKECLSILGDGSESAFELRNGNRKQLKCLSGDESLMSSALKMKCEAWKGCVAQSNKQTDLLALLKAASAAPPSLIAGDTVENLTVVADSDTCMHPSVDDPESWDCECAETMVAACAEKSESLEVCLQNALCAHSNVCASWKQNHCASLSAMAERSASTKAITSSSLHNDLDSATQGKCAEQ